MKKGIVQKSVGATYFVTLEDGEDLVCGIKGKFRIKGIKLTNPVAVGDEVEVSTEAETPVICKILPRRNYIIRRSVNLSKQYHVLASNVDQAIAVVSEKNPETNIEFLDRFLLSTQAYGIETSIVVNKIDLLNNEQLEEVKKKYSYYESMGYSVFYVSLSKSLDVQEIESLVKSKSTVLVGNSGVGKSTFLNLFAEEANQEVKEISEVHKQGVHTTTFAQSFNLKDGGNLIDTPGIKGYGVVDMQKEEVSKYFRDLFEFSKSCKFADCMHLEEPNCAVKKGISEGKILSSRYKSYLSILHECEESGYRT